MRHPVFANPPLRPPPNACECAPSAASAGGRMSCGLERGTGRPNRRAIGPRRTHIFHGFVTEGNEPPGACDGASQWHAVTTVDAVVTAAGAVLRPAHPTGGDAVTGSDVAAGAGRDVGGS